MKRRGFALAELMVALVISGIIGIALTKLVINQSRFVATQDAIMRARSGSRASLNQLASEIRMVSDSGLRAASKDSITIRVPFVFGVTCGYLAGTTVIGLIPADSTNYALAVPSGLAWRDTLGAWRFIEPITMTRNVSATNCSTNSITVVSNAKWASQMATATTTSPTIGQPAYFYQTITYVFATSVDMPGRRALWRAVPSAGLREEIVTPFDTSAKFQFITGNAQAVLDNPPAVLDSVVGIRARLVAASDNTPGGRTAPMTFNLITDFRFRNRVY